MGDVNQVLQRIEIEGGAAAEELLPLVYDELRRILVDHARAFLAARLE